MQKLYCYIDETGREDEAEPLIRQMSVVKTNFNL